MKDEGRQAINTACELGFISGQQGRQLCDEMEMFPGNVVNLMLKRHLITPEQLSELQAAMAGESAATPPPSQSAPPAPPAHPAARNAPQSPSPYAQPAPSPYAQPAGPGSGGGTPRGGVMPQPPVRPPVDPASVRSPYAPPLRSEPSAPSAVAARPPAEPSSRPAPAAAPAASASAPAKLPAASAGSVPIRPLSEKAGLNDYLTAARNAGCSDLHLCVGRPPFVRSFGEIIYLDEPDLTEQRAERLNLSALSPGQRASLAETLQLDFSFEIPGVGRHRCNVFKTSAGMAGSYRLITAVPRTLEELGMPPVLRTLTEFQQGLILVTGAGGSGKTTTVAAMVEHINRTREDHIITVEDPVEYVYSSAGCQVTQREVGRHTQSFSNALRAALRQDPDIIVVGELRDLETTSIAISAAETGHLVFGTLHTNTAARTVARIMDLYPPGQRQQICTMVAESLRGIITQQLIPRKDGVGLAVAQEVLVFHSGVAMAIKEGKTYQLLSLMQSGKRMGMKIMDDSLLELYHAGTISGRQAFARAENKGPFEAFKDAD